MMCCKSQLLISEEESLAESVQKYWCLYDKSCADYKNKVFVEWAVVKKKWALKRVKSFLISYAAWNVNKELANYFANALALSDCKSLPTSKNICFIISICRSTKILNVFVTVILKLENAMGPSGVPYHLFLHIVIWI